MGCPAGPQIPILNVPGNPPVGQALSRYIVGGISCEFVFVSGELNELGNLEKHITSGNAMRAPGTEREQDLCLKGCQSGLFQESNNLTEKNASSK